VGLTELNKFVNDTISYLERSLKRAKKNTENGTDDNISSEENNLLHDQEDWLRKSEDLLKRLVCTLAYICCIVIVIFPIISTIRSTAAKSIITGSFLRICNELKNSTKQPSPHISYLQTHSIATTMPASLLPLIADLPDPLPAHLPALSALSAVSAAQQMNSIHFMQKRSSTSTLPTNLDVLPASQGLLQLQQATSSSSTLLPTVTSIATPLHTTINGSSAHTNTNTNTNTPAIHHMHSTLAHFPIQQHQVVAPPCTPYHSSGMLLQASSIPPTTHQQQLHRLSQQQTQIGDRNNNDTASQASNMTSTPDTSSVS
jgi:hypothetical protein